MAAAPLYELIRAAPSPFARDTVNLLEVKDGAELVTLCRKRAVDLVILPETLDGVSGKSVCRTLKSLAKPPLVMMVMKSQERQLLDDMKLAGADEVIVGAYDGRSLIERSAKLLGVSVREAVRILTRLRVKSKDATPGPILLGTIIDISVSGMLVETGSELCAGDDVTAEFYLHGQQTQVFMNTRVMRIEQKGEHRHVGMKFLDQQDDHVAQIEAFVQMRTKTP